MITIQKIRAREILDSRGHPTVEVCVGLSDGSEGRASVPSGSSTGIHEAKELRDTNSPRFQGWGVLGAVRHVNQVIAPSLLGLPIENQQQLDQKLIHLDGTPNKSNLGANALLGVSLALLKARANSHHLPLYRELGGKRGTLLPVPLMNILNGGKHAYNGLNVQEFMIVPYGANSFSEALRMGTEIFYILKNILIQKRKNTNVGDEGGFAPNLQTTKQALDLLIQAIEQSHYLPEKQVGLALDVAASEFYHQGLYHFEHQFLTNKELIQFYEQLILQYPLVSIEDGLAQDDWEGWRCLTHKLGQKIQLVGDDLFTTNPDRLQLGIQKKVANAILIKPNQIGTFSETMQTILMAKKHHYHLIPSHRSGETEDTFIADLSVAIQSGQIKIGSLSRGERVSKYNRLLKIEEELGKSARYLGTKAFTPAIK